MRAILTNFGSTGSVYPFISLALEMQSCGHEAAVALSPFFADWVEHFGLEFIPVGPDLRKIQYAINEAMLEMPNSERGIRELFAPLMPTFPQMFEELRVACLGADALISGPWQPASLMLHELTGIPFVTVQNSHFGGGGTPEFQRASASLINPFRTRFGLPPVKNPLTIDANSPQLVLYNMSRHVRPPLPDWPAFYHMPGYFFLNDDRWQPDPELRRFVEAEPPVVITFGSMTHENPDALTEMTLQSINALGRRAVIQHGWSGLAKLKLPASVYIADFVPHDWLFPRAACIVHHGGAGTAASVFRSGTPSVFVPHTFDHPLWAELAVGLGCAGPFIPFSELSTERLTTSLRETLDNPAYREAAASIGEKVRAEQGLRRARQLIEDLVEKAGLHGSVNEALHDEISHTEQLTNRLSRRREYRRKQRELKKSGI